MDEDEQEAMSSGPSDVTQTTRTEPSPFLTGPISSAADAIGRPNALSNQALTSLFQRGITGSPVINDATDLTRQTLAGDFLTPDSNPFLQQTFDRAADLTRTRLSSEFAGSGRNLNAALPARSEELQTLASNIFGGNFARERALQANAVNQSLPLGNQDFTNIQAQLDAANFPTDNLIDRIAALAPAAGGTAVSSQPLTRNRATGALGGALAGAQLGTVIPGLGPGIGALGGGLLGLF